jgi:hypothetical protein
MPPYVVHTDVLNQVQMEMRKSDDLAASLRGVFEEIASCDAYAEWAELQQFAGVAFSCPPDLEYARTNKTKWLLNRLALADYDEILVRINRTGEHLFLTDGLWVPGTYRVFPFDDESDRIGETCTRLGWDDWATCVIDPAMGCGHNLLRARGDARRYGFDINARALSYAAINAAINEVPVGLLGVNDVADGLPPLFNQNRDDNVLVLCNMPFALTPELGTLPRSAEGGRFGYELTLRALDAVAQLATALGPGSELRCLMLAYSVGNLAADSWAVPDYARTIFDAEQVTWHLLEDELLWRVNGTKDQPNPMPLKDLELKADCRFYVQPPLKPDDVREGYRALTRELEHEGYDHLAYGVVEIRGRGREETPGT